MLAVTRRSDYAFVALTHLAQVTDGCTSAREIAAQYHIPLPLLMNILKQLANCGLTRSVRGPRGGYSLALPPDEITLYDVICAVEGPVQLVQCMSHDRDVDAETQQDCGVMGRCPVRSPMQRIHEKLVAFLKDLTLSDVAQETACCQSGNSAVHSGDNSSE